MSRPWIWAHQMNRNVGASLIKPHKPLKFNDSTYDRMRKVEMRTGSPETPSSETLIDLQIGRTRNSSSTLINCNCPGSPFAGVNSTCTGRKTMDFQHLNSALAYHYRAKRAYFGQYRDRFSTVACN